jgi:hypothetical protein
MYMMFGFDAAAAGVATQGKIHTNESASSTLREGINVIEERQQPVILDGKAFSGET